MAISSVNYYDKAVGNHGITAPLTPLKTVAARPIGPAWHAGAMNKLRTWDRYFDEKIPNNTVQKVADQFAEKFGNSLERMQTYLMKEFAPLVQFNALLEKYGRGEWYQQFAVFLIQLPFKAARNIVRMFYGFIETLCYTAAHPIKGLNHIGKQLITIAYECTKLQTWSQMGAGMLGASLGQAACGNPVSIVSFLIGSILLVDFTIAHLIFTAYHAKEGEEWKEVKEACISHIKALPEALATGFLMGVITVGIQRAILKYKKAAIAKFEFESRPYAEQFVKENGLPPYTKMHFENGKICLEWSGKDLQAFYDAHADWWTKFGEKFTWDNRPDIFTVNGCDMNSSLKIQLHPASSEVHLPMRDRCPASWGDEWYDVDYCIVNSTKVVPLEPTGMKVTTLPSKFPAPLPDMSSVTVTTPPESCPWCRPKLPPLLTPNNLLKPVPGATVGFMEENERS